MEQRRDGIDWQEVYERGILRTGNLARMSRVMRRALKGEEIRIAFLGGSITAGAAATTAEGCYAYLVYSWWKQQFPSAKIQYMNAGVGATTSKFGVARVKEDVLNLKPDVVFVEFSVNDPEEPVFQETYEGLIRTILTDRNEPAVFLINHVFYDDGRNTQRLHNEIGAYYDLPVVSMKESLFEEIRKGNLRNSDISADNLHPNDLGHCMAANVIVHLLEKIRNITMEQADRKAGGASPMEEAPDVYRIPGKPLTTNRFFGSTRRSSRNTTPETEGFRKDEAEKEGVWDVFRYGWTAEKAGSRIRFEAEGWLISVQYRKYAEHPAPVARAVIDGDKAHAVRLDANFDETWGDCLYLQDIFQGESSGTHTVEIILDQEVPKKEFYLASIITA